MLNLLQEQFLNETGITAINSQGEPDIDYVKWLEDKVEQLTPSDRSDVLCGDCGKLLPTNMECDNPECVRVIMRNRY